MNKRILCICETGVFIGLAVVFRFIFKSIPLCQMPQGGSISLIMLPIILNGYRNGLKYGLIGGLTYALIDFLLDGVFFHLGSIFFDYIFAYGLLGLSGLFKNKIKNIKDYIIGILICCFLRYLSHSLSGFIFFRDAISSFWASLTYSFIIYNGPYMLGSTILTLIISLPLYKYIIKVD